MKKKNLSIFAKLAITIPSITIIFWVISSVFLSQYLRNTLEKEFSFASLRMIRGLAQQSINDLKFADIYQSKRLLYNFYNSNYSDYFGIYTAELEPFAVYPLSELLKTKFEFIEEQVKRNSNIVSATNFFKKDDERRYHIQEQIKDDNGNILGYLFMGGSTSWLDRSVSSQVMYFILLGFAVLIVEIGVLVFFTKRFTKPLSQLTDSLNLAKNGPQDELVLKMLDHPPVANTCREVTVFDSILRSLFRRIKDHQEKEMSLSVQATLGRLTSHFAHDIRSPITNISHYLASHEPSQETTVDEKERFDTVKKNLRKIDLMADELTSYTKAREVRKVKTKVRDVLDEVRRDQFETANIKKIRIDVDCDENIIANIDIDKITRVLNNMVLNSIQAISHDHGEILITATVAGVDLLLSVRDNGCGIDSEHLPRIFDSSFTHGKIKGTGLGLAYCKNVVEAHNGSIETSSNEGKGTVFFIKLLNAVIVECVQHDPRIIDDVVKCDSKQWLIVDDTATMREMWRDVIVKQKLPPPVEMNNPEEVHRSGLNFKKFCGAIIDYNYDGTNMTGLDIIQFLKHKGLHNVHLCTGNYNDEKIRKEATRLKVASIIPKPIPEEVIDPTRGIFRPS